MNLLTNGVNSPLVQRNSSSKNNTQPNSSIPSHLRAHSISPSQPSVSFKGLDQGYFKMLLKLSLTFWGGLTAAVGTGIGAYALHHAPSTQAAQTIDESLNHKKALVKASDDSLSSVTPDIASAKVQAHQALVKKSILEQSQLIQNQVSTHANSAAVSKMLSQTDLTPDEIKATEAFLNGKTLENVSNPADAFDKWVDTVLDKRGDVETKQACKAAARTLFEDASINNRAELGLKLICALGTIVALGIGGFAALGGRTGTLMILGFAPAVAFGILVEAFKKKKKPAAPAPESIKTPPAEAAPNKVAEAPGAVTSKETKPAEATPKA
ncbi:MAG: hypothetical protein K2X66_03160 [Cyanobacteria bacterium]|nr:hypothetical protein [Cyanobacteriota bacterium]